MPITFPRKLPARPGDGLGHPVAEELPGRSSGRVSQMAQAKPRAMGVLAHECTPLWAPGLPAGLLELIPDLIGNFRVRRAPGRARPVIRTGKRISAPSPAARSGNSSRNEQHFPHQVQSNFTMIPDPFRPLDQQDP